MKNFLFLFLAVISFVATGCEKDPHALDLDRFDVRWFDDDNSGTQTSGDVLQFQVQINTTDPDHDDQFITEWEFSYTVNGHFAGVLQGDENANSNGVTLNAEVAMDRLTLPGPGTLQPGDTVEFRVWAIDNHGIDVEQFHRFVLED